MRYACDCVKAQGVADGLRSETVVDLVAQFSGKRKKDHFGKWRSNWSGVEDWEGGQVSSIEIRHDMQDGM